MISVASHADVVRLVTREGGTRDKPKKVCVGGYDIGGLSILFSSIESTEEKGNSSTLIFITDIILSMAKSN